VALGASVAILPWTARNALLRGDLVLIETVGLYNLWNDNAFVDEGQHGRQEQRMFNSRNTPARTRELAVEFALRGIARHPEAFLDKLCTNLRYSVRPDTMHGLLVGLAPIGSRWDLLSVPLGDLMMLLALPPFLVFAAAGPRSPERTLLLGWLVYYFLLLVVVFHVETRYRSPLAPFVLAFAAAGVEQLIDSSQRQRLGVRLSFATGVAIVVVTLLPYAEQAWHAVRSAAAVARADQAWRAGERTSALRAIAAAAAADPNPARPWLDQAQRLARRGEAAAAIEALRQVEELAPGHVVPAALLPRLLLDVGRTADADEASETARRLSWLLDPWLVLEHAWRRLPPPRTAELTLGLDDYGAARGFLHPFRNYRWTRDRAWLRLRPPFAERSLELRLEMGSPEPSPYERPAVAVRACDGPWQSFELTREVRPYVWRAACPPDTPVVVEIRTPTFNKAGQHDDQGVRVDRLVVRPAPR
jgi:hypothetical protein